MTRTRLGLLGLCAMVFGLMAFSASAAQAEAGAKWLLAKSDKTPVTFLEAEVALEAETTGVLHSKIAGVAVLFECTTLSAVKAKLLASGEVGEGGAGGAKGSKVKFSGCTTKLNGTTSAACEPIAGGTEKGVINTVAGHGALQLSPTGSDVINILPDSGETFATIEMGEECSIGEKVPVIGKAVLKDCEAKGRDLLAKHLLEVGSKAEGTELWVISKTEEHVSTILGSGWAKLAGSHAGLLVAGDPN